MIMKKILVIGLCVAMLAGCGHPQELTVNGKTKEYPTYGLFNQDTSKSENVCYEPSFGNVVWSVIGIENIVMPVYFIGFSIFNPVSVKVNGKCPGIDG